MKRKILLILFLFLIIFCVQSRALADFSYFEEVDAVEVELYFLRSSENCIRTELVPVECVIENTNVIEKVVRSTIERLLKGPTEEERKRLDLWTSIPEGVKINSIQVNKDTKTVRIDFSGELHHGGGSFNALCIMGQIEKTLKQFAFIEEVIITIEGKGEKDGVLQP